MEITPKICRLCVCVLINKRSFEHFMCLDLLNKYVLQLWLSKWDEFPEIKFHKIFPDLKDRTACPQTNRREETVIAGLHIGHSHITQSILLKGEEPPMCFACDERLTVEHIILFC